MASILFSKIFNIPSRFRESRSNEVMQQYDDKGSKLSTYTTDEDTLDKLLNEEKVINDVYEHRLDLVRKALSISGDTTVDELIDVINFLRSFRINYYPIQLKF